MSDSEIPEIKTKQPVSLCGVMSDSEIPETKAKQSVSFCLRSGSTETNTDAIEKSP